MAGARVSIDELRSRLTKARAMPALLALQRDLRQAMNDASDELDNGGGGDQAEVQALWTQLKGLFDELSDRILRVAERDEFERRQAGIPIGGSTDQQWNRRLVEYRIAAAIAGAMGQSLGINLDAGPERETSQELAKRSGSVSPSGFLVPRAALSIRVQDASPGLLRGLEKRIISTTTPAAGPGGNIIATVWDTTQWVDALRANVAVRALGARVLSDLTANLNLPRLKLPAVTGWFAENSAIPTSDEEFDDVLLRPKHAGAIVSFSRNMMQQALNPGIEAIVRNDLAMVLARAVDTAAVSGAGDAVTPLGIVTDPAVANVGTAAAPTYDLLVDVTSLLAERNALAGSLGWLGDAWVRGGLLKLKDLYGRPYGFDLLFQGYPYEFTNLATVSGANPHPIIFANFDDLVIGEWSSLDLLVNPYDSDAYSKGNCLVRAAMTIDIQKRHVESFGYMTTTLTAVAAAAEAPTPPANGAPRVPRR
jgi:HK97 family phage major capsid protein